MSVEIQVTAAPEVEIKLGEAVSNAIYSDAIIADNTIVRGDGGQRKVQDSSITIDDSDNIAGVTSISFDITQDGVAAVEGKMVWNDTDGTANIGMKGGNVNQQVGLELFAPRARATGTAINNGQLVYVSGATGNIPEMSLAQANTIATAKGTIAMATEDITQNQLGYYTAFGLVRDVAVPTATYSDGDELFLSASSAGGFTNVEPSSPNYCVKVGTVIRAHDTAGVIFVAIEQLTVGYDHVYGMTAGYIPFADANGFLTEDSDLSFSGDTLSATKVSIGTNLQIDSQTLSTVSTGTADNGALVTKGYVDDADDTKQDSLSTAQLSVINSFSVSDNAINALLPVNLSSLTIEPDSGIVTVADMGVTYRSAYGDEEGFQFILGGKKALKVYGTADGAGGIDDVTLEVDGAVVMGHTTETTFDDSGSIIVDDTVEYNTIRVVAGSTHSLTASGSGNVSGNYKLARYTFDVDCTLTLTGFDSSGSTLGTVNPIPSGTYNFWFYATAFGVGLVIQNNTGTTPGTLSTPTLVMVAGNSQAQYIITNIDTNATAGVLEYSDDNAIWNTWGSYSFGTETGYITGLVNNQLYYFRYRNSASGYTASQYATDTSTPSASTYSSKSGLFTSSETDYITSTSRASSLEFSNGSSDSAFSLSAWIKVTSVAATQRILRMETTTPPSNIWGNYELLVLSDSTVRLNLYDDDGSEYISIISGTTISADTWYNIIVTYDASGVNTGFELYVDGVIESSPSRVASGSYVAMSACDSTSRFVFGRYGTGGGGGYIDGLIDEVSVWSKELNQSEVSEIFNSGEPNDLSTHSAVSSLELWTDFENAIDDNSANAIALTNNGVTYSTDVSV